MAITLRDLLGPSDSFSTSPLEPGTDEQIMQAEEGNELARRNLSIRTAQEMTQRDREAEGRLRYEDELIRGLQSGNPYAIAEMQRRAQIQQAKQLNFKMLIDLAKGDPDTASALLGKLIPGLPQGRSRLERIEEEERLKNRIRKEEIANAGLGIETASKLYRYNPETKELEIAPANISSAEAQRQGFRVVDKTFMNRLDEISGVRPAFGALKVAVEGANRKDPASLAVGRATGGYLGAEEGKVLDIATRDFALQFDRLLGGVRGAASVQLFEAMRRRMPEILQKPELRLRSLTILEGILDTMEDNALRRRFGLPLDKAGLKKAEDAANLLIKMVPEKTGARSGEPSTATTENADLVSVINPLGKRTRIRRSDLDRALGEGYKEAQ